MKPTALVMISLMSLATPACVITQTAPRDVGALNADGTVYLGWHLISRPKNNANDRETYDVGAQLGNFSAIRIHVDSPVSLAQVTVIFANGEQWAAPAPPALNKDEWSAPIQFPGGARPIHSVVVDGRSTASTLARLEVHGTR